MVDAKAHGNKSQYGSRLGDFQCMTTMTKIMTLILKKKRRKCGGDDKNSNESLTVVDVELVSLGVLELGPRSFAHMSVNNATNATNRDIRAWHRQGIGLHHNC